LRMRRGWRTTACPAPGRWRTDVAEFLTPACPLCGQAPRWLLGGGTQAFCGNDDCTILTWDPSQSLDDNLLDTQFVRLDAGEDES
jgi:hypothetical protein